MKGYVVTVYKVIKDENVLKTYAVKAREAIEKHKGQFLVRGGNQIEVEGGLFERTVLVEFESFTAAKNCYESDAYQATYTNHVTGSAIRYVVLVEGV